MAVSLLSLTLVLGFLGVVDVVVTFPVKPGRRRSVSFAQMTKFGSSRTASHRPLGECTEIQDIDVPTEVQLAEHERGVFNLVTYSTPCSYQDRVETGSVPLHRSLIVNGRQSICSFHLEHQIAHPATVIFYKEMFTGFVKTVQTSDHTCIDICSSPGWTRYAKSVEILINGQPSSTHVHLYSDSDCDKEVAKVGHASDLVALTRMEETRPPVKSFEIFVE